MNKNSDIGRARRRPLVAPAASLTGALAAALVPQTADAALVTVGGDGGTGSVTLENIGDSTDLGGLLIDPILYFQNVGPGGPGEIELRMPGLGGEVFRSSVAQPGLGANTGTGIVVFQVPGWRFLAPGYGGLLDSSDNWLPGRFRVNGVNGGNPIQGWLQIRLGGSPGNYDPTILSFTYNDEATNDAPFVKPIGGFSLPGTETDPVPEPGTLGLLGLGLGAAFVSRMRRGRSADRWPSLR